MPHPSSSKARPSWSAFIVCIAVAVLTILDLVKVNVTLTSIEQSLGVTTSEAQLIVAGYVLAFGIMLVPAGRLGDQWNRKAMFVIGLIGFGLASAASALAPDGTTLVIARITLGASAGVLMPQVLGMIQQLFQGQQRGQAFGIFGAAVGLGTAFGPTIGGLFIQTLGPELGWRWTFGMNVPLVLIILPLALVLLPPKQPHEGPRDLDLVGVALLALTVLGVMLPFVLTSGSPDDPAWRWWFLALAVPLGLAFIAWERHVVHRGGMPALDFRLFRFSSYRNGVLITALWFFIMPASFLMMTLYLQQGLGYAALIVGLVTVPYAIVSAIVAWIAGRYTYRFASKLVVWGLGIFLGGLIALILIGRFASPEAMPWAMMSAFAVAGIGPGLVMSANQMRTLSRVPIESAGVGGSFQQVGQRLGNAIGIAVAASVFYSIVEPVSANHDLTNPDRLFVFRTAYEVSLGLLLAVGVVALVFALIDRRADLREQRERASTSEDGERGVVQHTVGGER